MTPSIIAAVEKEAIEKYPPFLAYGFDYNEGLRRAYIAGKLSALEKVGEAWDACSLFWVRLLDQYDSRLTKTHERLLSDNLPDESEAAKTAFIENLLK